MNKATEPSRLPIAPLFAILRYEGRDKKGKLVAKVRGVAWVLVLTASIGPTGIGFASSDELDPALSPLFPPKAVNSYQEALGIWKRPEDIAAWIGGRFSYDHDRAKEFSETHRRIKGQIVVYDPAEFFGRKAGVCVDLAHFAVETLKRIDPACQPKYLMIEFEPILVEGHLLRRHWLVSFRREGKVFFFADSKRPGHIAGPFNTLADFVREYERYRQRKILRFQELDSYQKRRKTEASKRQSRIELLGRGNRAMPGALLSGQGIANEGKSEPYEDRGR